MRLATLAFVFTAAALAAPAAMAVSTFNLYDDSPPGECFQNASGAGTFGNQYTCSAENSYAQEMNVKAFSNTGSGSKFAAAYIGDYAGYSGGGFGIKNTVETMAAGQPAHSMDNSGQLDMMLFSFTSSIALTQLQLGWWQTDSDVTILAWTGNTSNAVSTLTNSSASNLVGSGWSLVGNYSNLEYNNTAINAGNISSSYWLVSAYSNTLGGGGWTEGNDYVKLRTLAGNFTCVNSNDPGCTPPGGGQVPEPLSLALVGAALFGAYGSRRRAKGQGAAQA